MNCTIIIISLIQFFTRQIVKFNKFEQELQVIEQYEKFKDRIEFTIYKYFKDKNFFVTSGIKYGADFLLYKDDPNFIHSEYLVYIKDYKTEFNFKDIINGERISLSHKKKFLVVSVNDDKKVKIFNLEWLNI